MAKHRGRDRPAGGARLDSTDAVVEKPRRRFELRFTLGPTARRITYRFTSDGRIVLLTTFRKQRNNERAQIARARAVAQACARNTP